MSKSKLLVILATLIVIGATLSAKTPMGPITKALKGNMRGLSATDFEAEYAVFKKDFVEFFTQALAQFREEKYVESKTETFRANLYMVQEYETDAYPDGVAVIGIGTFSYMNAVPMLVGVWNPDTGGIRYMEFPKVLIKEADIATTSAPEAFLIDKKFLLMILGPREDSFIEKSISTEAQTAIQALRKTHDVYMQTNGSLKGFTMDMALKETRLDESTLKSWKLSVDYKGNNVPYYYIATSTSENIAGPGLKVWYDVNEARFHGYGIDSLKSPN